MGPFVRLMCVLTVTLAVTAQFVQPAAANTKKTTAIHVDDRFVDRRTCDFDIRVHVFGQYKAADYYDNSGFLYKTILTAGGGLFSFTETANGTTLTMQMQSVQVIITYNTDGSRDMVTNDGLANKFTLPGGGVVLLDTGRTVFDFVDDHVNLVFEAGPDQAFDGDVDAFCAAFG